MAPSGNKRSHKNVQLRMRTIHRILGYLAVGMVIVYALSGIILIQRTGDFMKSSEKVSMTLLPGLDAGQLEKELKIKKFKVTAEDAATISFAEGSYNKASGEVSYTKKEVVAPFNSFINLHKVSEKQSGAVAWIATVFGIVLFLLAFTSLFMYKPGNKQFRTNMLYTAVGVVLAVTLILVV